MNKTLLIGVGAFILLLVIGMWTYLFLFGAPENTDEVFGRFFSDTTVVLPEVDTTIDVSSPDQNGKPQALRQLTTRPVAGATFIGDSIRYVEKGTGYVYDISLVNGEETLVSNTTIPQTVEANLSEDGRRMILTAQRSERNEVIVASVAGTSSLDGVSLPSGVSNVSWGDNGVVHYLLLTTQGSSGYSYSPTTSDSTRLFDIPLRDVVVLWGSPTYVYTTPTARQTGYAYKLVKGQLSSVRTGGKGLMATRFDGGVVITESTDEGVLSSLPYAELSLPVTLLPEKCVPAPQATSTLYCATQSGQASGELPDDWYKGVLSFSDSLWRVDLSDGSSLHMSDFLGESGREIDVSRIGTNTTGEYIYFINKNDDTLWMFDTTI